MARSKQATESFTLLVYQTSDANRKKNVKFPGVMKVRRQYTDGSDSQRGDWYQLVPGLFYQRHADRTTAKKGGRVLNAQFEDIEIQQWPHTGSRLSDWKG